MKNSVSQSTHQRNFSQLTELYGGGESSTCTEHKRLSTVAYIEFKQQDVDTTNLHLSAMSLTLVFLQNILHYPDSKHVAWR